MKALNLLKKNKSVEERAETFGKSIKRDLQKEIIDVLVAKEEKIDDDLFELADFSLATDLNKGKVRMTKDDCKERFEKIIELEYEKTLVSMELKVKKASFDKYFGEPAADNTIQQHNT